MALVVAVEGLPGCGKTTAIELMQTGLRCEGLRVATVDIDAVPRGQEFRTIANAYPLGHPARSMLFWVLRIQQYEEIERLRDSMDVVFSDRSWGTALAFDGYGNGVSLDFLTFVGQALAEPDITFFFAAPLALVRQRKASRTMQDFKFARRVEQGYKALSRARAWLTVDATQNPEEVKDYCLEIIRSALWRTAHQS